MAKKTKQKTDILHKILYPVAIVAVLVQGGAKAIAKVATSRNTKRTARNYERRWAKKFQQD